MHTQTSTTNEQHNISKITSITVMQKSSIACNRHSQYNTSIYNYSSLLSSLLIPLQHICIKLQCGYVTLMCDTMQAGHVTCVCDTLHVTLSCGALSHCDIVSFSPCSQKMRRLPRHSFREQWRVAVPPASCWAGPCSPKTGCSVPPRQR